MAWTMEQAFLVSHSDVVLLFSFLSVIVMGLGTSTYIRSRRASRNTVVMAKVRLAVVVFLVYTLVWNSEGKYNMYMYK